MAHSKRKDPAERHATPPTQIASSSTIAPQTPSSLPPTPLSSPTSPSLQPSSSSPNDSPKNPSSSSAASTNDLSSSITLSTTPSPSARSLTSQTIYDRLNVPELSAAYVGTSNITQRVEYQTAKNIDLLVRKGTNSEFILRGVFLLARNDFFLTPDGSYNPDNNFRSSFEDTKLSCRMTAPIGNDFPFAVTDLPKCVRNLLALQNLITPEKDDEVMSTITEYLGKPQFKVTHALFESKTNDLDEELGQGSSDNRSETSDVQTDNKFDDLSTEFEMENWPVADRCQPLLQNLYHTHDICPLPAYDVMGNLIPPSQYESVLRGATVELHFSFAHHYIKKGKRHIFNNIIRQINVLRPPSALPTSPFKRLRIGASTHHRYTKGKRRAF